MTETTEEGLARTIGIVTGLLVALKVAVRTHPQAAALRGHLEHVREVATTALLKEACPDTAFEGIEVAIRDFAAMLPAQQES